MVTLRKQGYLQKMLIAPAAGEDCGLRTAIHFLFFLSRRLLK
jgi:hypothetical protein